MELKQMKDRKGRRFKLIALMGAISLALALLYWLRFISAGRLCPFGRMGNWPGRQKPMGMW